jgi:PAS domain S-box-containing protein
VPDSQPAGPVLILTPTGRDASCAQHLLTREGVDCRVCPSLDALCDGLDDVTGAVLVADEALTRVDMARLTAHLSNQEPWSDLPFVVLTQPVRSPSAHRSLAEAHLPEVLGNVMFLERPLQALTLVSAVRAALRARRRQRQVRSYLAERIEAAERLAASEERMRMLAESIEDVFYMVDLARRALLYLSPAYEQVWGRPAPDLLEDRASVIDTLHPDDRATLLRAWEAQERGEPAVLEYRILHPDGSVRWVLDRTFPVAGAAGRRAAGIVSDITDRKRAEAALREGEERLRLIVENARDYAILITDPQDIITAWFPGAAAVFGWSADEIIGKPGGVLFTPEDRATGEPEKEIETTRRENAAPIVRWHLRKDGRRVFLDGQTIALRHPDGSLRGFLKIGQDVTERRAAQEQLARSEALFRTLATGIQQLVLLSRPDGSRTWSSPQWIEFTGLSLEESVGFGWLAAIHPEDREQTRQHWAAAQALGDYYVEHRIRRASDGLFRWHQTRARPFDPESKTTSEWVGASTDVHDLRELQEQQAVLVAELQHRTRNLIGVVRSLADRTLADSPSLDEFQDRFRDRLAALSRVQGLLSRKEAGQKVTFDELIRMELTGLGAIDQEGHGRQVTLDGPEGVRLRSAMVQTLALALHELATNAIKYGALARPEGRLRVRWGLIDRADNERRLRVEWQESGVVVPLGQRGEPLRQGYGRELIERALPYQLGAETQYELRPDGVRCTITLPISTRHKEIADA